MLQQIAFVCPMVLTYRIGPMALIKDLPPKYYLGHFQEFIEVVSGPLRPFLGPEHLSWLSDYSALSEDAKCLLIRMVNRKGHVFSREALQYAEIKDRERALEELLEKKFIRYSEKKDLEDLLRLQPKDLLTQELLNANIAVARSKSKQEILKLSLLHIKDPPWLSHFLIHERRGPLSYLLFLYFGRLEENLTLYTLRDLGVRSASLGKTFAPKFKGQEEAQSHFFYAKRMTDKKEVTIEETDLWPAPLNPEASELRNHLLIHAAKTAASQEESLALLSLTNAPAAREQRVRLLHQLKRFEDCELLLQEMVDHPTTDEEAIFAENFLGRKFQKKRRSLFTEMLHEAPVMSVDESFYKHPEEGVISELIAQGKKAFHTENYLWNALFGLMFWHELFESEKALGHNQFDRLPSSLSTLEFFQLHEKEIELKLELLQNTEKSLAYVREMIAEKEGFPNGIFAWHASLVEELTLFLSSAPLPAVAQILHYMVQDYTNRSTGFPDIMVVGEDVHFIEVKAPGDSLKAHQLKQLLRLRNAGLNVEILRVEYTLNPRQTYVVLDLETTGGTAIYHRITEIGAVKVRSGEVIETFQTLVNPGRPIPRQIQQLTGITNEMVASAPSFQEVAESLQEFLKGSILVAHNAAFDYSFLQKEFERLDVRFTRPYLCTKNLMKKYYPKLNTYSLKGLTTQFQIPLQNHHRALCDAEAAAQLLILINKRRNVC